MSAVPRVAVTLEQCWHRVPGGTAVSILGAVAALAARPDVEVVGVSARHRRPPADPWQPSVPVRSLPLARRALYESWHYLRRPRVERATGAVDVIHATTFAIPPASVPLVVTVHDLAFLHDPSHFTRHGLRFFRRGLDLVRRDATLVTCPTADARDDCERHGLDPDRLRVVPWGVDATPVAPGEPDRVRREYRLDRPFVLFTGTVEPRKNLARLIDGFARLDRDDVDLVLVGPAGWNEQLDALVASSSVTPRVLGWVPTEDLRALYAAATVFCYPSLREGFGLPALEAMAQGTPVVTSAGTAVAEVVADAGVLVDPHDPAAIGDAIGRLLDDPSEAARLAERGTVRAGHYTWERTGELLLEVYREAAG